MLTRVSVQHKAQHHSIQYSAVRAYCENEPCTNKRGLSFLSKIFSKYSASIRREQLSAAGVVQSSQSTDERKLTMKFLGSDIAVILNTGYFLAQQSPSSGENSLSRTLYPQLPVQNFKSPKAGTSCKDSDSYQRSARNKNSMFSYRPTAAVQRDEQHLQGPVHVFVMLPLDSVNADGVFRYATASWFLQALQFLAWTGVRGVAVDIWWGAVEREPRQYVWSGYKQLFEVVKSFGLKLQVVLSFHACGGNVGDSTQIPLPCWVLQAGEHDPDLWFTDRPRANGLGQRNREYISIFADDAPGVLQGRSPLQCYEDFMIAFRDAFAEDVGSVIEEVVVGAGPCGELRYPSYVEANGWRFPGIGEFQCYDRRALASLAHAARQAGRPEWGNGGPHNAGTYNSNPEETGFFSWDGSWDSPYGRFFLDWYSGSLLQHGERLLAAARRTFQHKLVPDLMDTRDSVGDCSTDTVELSVSAPPDSTESPGPQLVQSAGQPVVVQQQGLFPAPMLSRGTTNVGVVPMSEVGDLDVEPSDTSLSSIVDLTPRTDFRSETCSTRFGFSSSTLADSADCCTTAIHLAPSNSTSSFSTDGNWAYYSSADIYEEGDLGLGFMQEEGEDASISRATSANDCSSPEESRRCSHSMAAAAGGEQVMLTLKVAGIHWWFRSPSHAAELTAGYHNTDTHDGYRPIVELCARYGANLTLTCVEMCDQQHPLDALCGPEGLLRQVRTAATLHNVQLSGENALPIFMVDGIDSVALDRIVRNTAAVLPARPQGPYCASTFQGPMLGNIVAAGRHFLDHARPVMLREPVMHRAAAEAYEMPLPPMRTFTFLRLGPEMLAPVYQTQWLRFMRRMVVSPADNR